MSGKITSNGSGSVMGARQIIRDGLIAYWDAANYLSVPTASTAYFGAYGSNLFYDLIGQNHLTATGPTVKYKTAYNSTTLYNPFNGHFSFPNSATPSYFYNGSLTGDMNSTSLPGLTLEFVGQIGDDAFGSAFFAKGTNLSFSTADYSLYPNKNSTSNQFTTMSFSINVGGTNYTLIADDIAFSPGYYPTQPICHICSTYDGSTMKLYIDGIQSSKTTSISGPIRNTGNVCGFFYHGSATYVAAGYFLIFRIYNRALSFQEIQQNYLAQKGRYNNTPPSP